MRLKKRGHEVAVFANEFGPSASRLSAAGIPIVTRVSDIPFQPEAIHSNHWPQSLLLAAAYPLVPQIFECHDPKAWHSAPPTFAGVRTWIAVDEICRERILTEANAIPEQVTLLPNAVDLDQYPLRKELPARPRRAMVLTKSSEHLEIIRRVCRERSLELIELGPGAGRVVDNLGEHFQDVDIVFATARMAVESIASGCAVVVVDGRGLAGMVTTKNMDIWRSNNFGKRLQLHKVDTASLNAALEQYDSIDARIVSLKTRKVSNLDERISALEEIYRTAIEQTHACPLTIGQVLAEFPSVTTRLLSWNHVGLASTDSMIPFFIRVDQMRSESDSQSRRIQELESSVSELNDQIVTRDYRIRSLEDQLVKRA